MTSYCNIKTAAQLIGCTERYIRMMCQAGKFAGAVKDGSNWNIPRTCDERLWVADGNLKDTDKLDNISARKRNEALKRLGIINQFEDYASQMTALRVTRKDAIINFARQNNVNRATLYRWISGYQQYGIIGLVDSRGAIKGSDNFTPAAAERFKTLYLDERRPSLKQCWQTICYENSKSSNGWNIPSLRSMYNWIEANIPMPVQIRLREGQAAYDAKCAPYVQTDPDSVMPGAVWVGDHHQFNCWVLDGKGGWVRPWITAWLDKRTRTLVGWDINTGGNQTSILRAMRRGIETYGPPDAVKIDNGRDYDSEMWTGVTKSARKSIKAGYLDESAIAGIYGMMGISVSFSIPYHPQSKNIERYFDTLDMQFTKTFDTYCGKDSARKPDDLNDKLKSENYMANHGKSFDEFSELLEKYISIYNNSSHTGVGMEGRSPLQVLNTRISRRHLDSDVLDMLLCVWSGEVKVGKNGVRFKNLLYGQFESQLLMHFGRAVRLAYNPDDLRSVIIYDAKTLQKICVAQQNQLISYGDAVSEDALRDAMAAKARALKHVKAFKANTRVASMDLPSLTLEAMAEAAMPEPDTDKPLNIRPVRTAFDGQAKQHKLDMDLNRLKKAAGAESMSLNFDMSKIKNNSKERPRLGLLK